MSRFDDLMQRPLPSRSRSAESMLAALEADLGIEEGFDDIDTVSDSVPVSAEEDVDMPDSGSDAPETGDAAECGDMDDDEGFTRHLERMRMRHHLPSFDDNDNDDDEVSDDDIEDISDEEDEDDFAPDGMDDDELRALDDELSGSSSIPDDEEKLTPDEEIKADDMMKVAATTLLVNDELNSDEKKEFCSSESETATVLREGFMTEADINELAASCGLMTEARYTNKMIIKLDAESKKKQLYALAVNVSAAAHNDPDYIKLKKVMKMRKILRAKLDRKYHGEAMKRMKVYYNRLRKSKSTTLQKVSK